VLDFAQPSGPRWRDFGGRRQTGFDNPQPGAGTLTQHVRLIGTEIERVESRRGPAHRVVSYVLLSESNRKLDAFGDLIALSEDPPNSEPPRPRSRLVPRVIFWHREHRTFGTLTYCSQSRNPKLVPSLSHNL
jgi:hypothetical protein